jgi:protein phosphatase
VTLQLRYVTHSEIGLIRKNNQDSGFASPHLLVVADGMGGAAAGDLASAVAIDTIKRIEGVTEGRQMLEVLAGAIHKANDRIADLVEADPSLDGMGTTVTGAMFDGAELGLAHIGDSRAYRLRDNQLERLTHDHSWVQSLVDEGKISDTEAAAHPHRSLLLKVLNGQPANDPDLAMVPVEVGDRLMFCSDGVCGLIDDDEIEAALRQPDLHAALDQLVSESLAEGGIDNITVIVADVVDGGGTEGAVVLGAAEERVIPPSETRLRDGAGDSEVEDTLVTERPLVTVDDEARYTPRAPGKRRLARPLVGVLVLLLIAAAGLSSAYAWTRTQYYVGVSADHVAIYQGLSDGVPGVRLSRVFEVQPLSIGDLPPYYQDQVRANIDVPNLQAARETIVELTAAAERCTAKNPPRESPRPTPRATTTPTSTPATTPSATPAGPGGQDC